MKAPRSVDSGLRYAAIAACALWLSGCPEEPPPPPPPAPTATAVAASPSAAASGATEKASELEAQPVCKREGRKVWSKHANPRTGITAKQLSDGRVALGVAIGNRPHSLLFDKKGKGTFASVKLEDASELSKAIKPADGIRHLQRVTVIDGQRAFADYRDKYKSGRRRIACGPINGEPYLLFDGEPLLETDDSGRSRKRKPPATSSAAPSASAAATASASATPAPPAAGGSGADSDKETVREIRDCRTFADAAGSDIWSVGSELVGRRQQDGSRKWSMSFFVVPKAGTDARSPLHRIDYREQPDKLHTLEAPVANRLADGSFVLAGRYLGRMHTWLLSDTKAKKGELHKYGGGYPSLPRVIRDGGDHLLLTSQKVDLSRWKLRALRLRKPSKLLDALSQPKIGGEDSSAAEPTFARAGEQRWLSYHAGDRRKGRVTLVPVDDELNEVGRSFVVTDEGVAAYESHLFGIEGDKLLVVYISRPERGKPAELVSEVLSCSVQK